VSREGAGVFWPLSMAVQIVSQPPAIIDWRTPDHDSEPRVAHMYIVDYEGFVPTCQECFRVA